MVEGPYACGKTSTPRPLDKWYLVPGTWNAQQGEVLTYLMCDPDRETSMSELARRVGAPLSSVHREVARTEAAGIVTSRRSGNTKYVRADTDSPS